MITIPNFLSLLRIPLALLFLKESAILRALAIVLAILTDGLDGFLARRYRQSSRIGTLLDPLTDRFFVYFVIVILLNEKSLAFWEASTLLCRDISIVLFGFYLLFTGKIATYRFRAIWCGKATTLLQFLVFLAITFNFAIPPFMYIFFAFLGVLALIELYLSRESERAPIQ